MIVEDFDFNAGLAEANRRAKEMMSNGLYSRFGLNDQERIRKAELGCMGEVAFEHWLGREGVEYEIDDKAFDDRNSDEFDFRINGKSIDVKVAKLSTQNPPSDNWRFGVPVEQKPGLKDVLIIGWVDFRASQVGFYGWMTGERVARCPVVLVNSLTGTPYLTPNHEFRWGDLEKNIRSIFVA